MDIFQTPKTSLPGFQTILGDGDDGKSGWSKGGGVILEKERLCSPYIDPVGCKSLFTLKVTSSTRLLPNCKDNNSKRL